MKSSLRRFGTAIAVLAVGLTMTTSAFGGSAAEPSPETLGASPPAEPAYRHILRTHVSTRLAGPVVTIVVREHFRGQVVKSRSLEVRPVPGPAGLVRVVMRSPREHPRYTVRMVAPPLGPGHGVLLGDTDWRHEPVGLLDPEQPDPEQPDPDEPDPGEPDPEEPDPEQPEPQQPGALSNGCTYSERGIPSCGAYLGQTFGSNTDPSTFEQSTGRRLGVRRTYFTASRVDAAVRAAQTDLAAGRLPWISFKLPSSWAQMAAGAGDAWASDLATKMGRLGGPVWLAFHHEPEGDGNIDDWRRMQERLVPIIRAQKNLAFTVVVTGWNQFYGDKQYSLDNIWPRGVKVDVAGFDVYNQLGVVKDGKENTKGTDLNASYFSKIAPWALEHNVAWGLAETGFTHKGAELDPHWIRRTHNQLVDAGGVAFAYFNTTLHSVAPWNLGTSTKLAGWREAHVDTPLLPPH